MIVWKANNAGSVTRVEAERLTESSVWVAGKRYARNSPWGSFHETREAAVQEVRQALSLNVRRAEERLAYTQTARAEFEQHYGGKES